MLTRAVVGVVDVYRSVCLGLRVSTTRLVGEETLRMCFVPFFTVCLVPAHSGSAFGPVLLHLQGRKQSLEPASKPHAVDVVHITLVGSA